MIKIYQDINGIWYSYLCNNNFNNVWGKGLSKNSALVSIKIRINQLKIKKCQ